MNRSLPHESKFLCGAPTKECRACLKRWSQCQQCTRLYLKGESSLTSCPECREVRQSRYRYSAAEKHLAACPMCEEPRPCDRTVKRAGARCHNHGGASKKGAEHANFKHGFRSKDAPIYLMQRYQSFLNNPERQSLQHEIALSQALVADSLSRLYRGESGEAWKQLQTTFEGVIKAIRSEDQAAITEALNNHYVVIRRGGNDEAARRELRAALELTGKLKERDLKREKDLHQMISLNEFYILLNQSLAIVDRYVPKSEHGKLHEEFAKMMKGEPD